MHKLIRQFATAAAFVAATALSPQAQAVTSVLIDFEPPALTGLYFSGESFTQNGFTMTVGFDAGIVDTAAALGGSAPSGNATQYYTQLNDGYLDMQRTDGGLFDLTGFDAAFVPLSPPASGTTVMVAVAVYADDSSDGVAWFFADKVGSSYPFARYDAPVDFAYFKQVKLVEFYSCSYDGANFCAVQQNNGQFAIDNITATVPEPATTAMLTLGLLALAMRRRSSR